MFSFFQMQDTYDERKVDLFIQGKLVVDTVLVTDGNHPYETAVKHPSYNKGEYIIVEAYDTKEEAREGHNRWVKTMTENPPSLLVDCGNSFIQELGIALGVNATYEKEITNAQ